MLLPHPTFSVTVEDTTGKFASQINTITQNALAAFSLWGNFLFGSANIEVKVEIVDVASDRGDGSSATTVFLENAGGFRIYEQGLAAELRTGIDPNGILPDVIIHIDPTWMSSVLWFDPNPYDNNHDIPNDKVDSEFFFLHELGHAIGFNGWRDWSSGVLPADYMSPFDARVGGTQGAMFFHGPSAREVYGSPVPLTTDNLTHYGNSQGPGVDLISGLMNGVVSKFGTKYQISTLDLAILQDARVNVVIEKSGTGGADSIAGNPINEAIAGNGGDDTITGAGGNDTVVAGLGRDYIALGHGNDVGLGNQDDDIVLGNQGNDIVVGGQGNDIVVGGMNNDVVFGNEANDILLGNEDADTIYGGQGADLVYGGRGDDLIIGGEGADTLLGNEGADRFVFGAGHGFDAIQDFSQGAGDTLDFQGQTYTQGTAADGDVLLTLSGGGTVELNGIAPLSFSSTFVA